MERTITMGDLVALLSQRDQSEVLWSTEDDQLDPVPPFVDIIFGLGETITQVDLPRE